MPDAHKSTNTNIERFPVKTFGSAMSTSEPNALPFVERPDLSPYLVHLTRNTGQADNHSAYDNLVNILEKAEIRGSGSAGYVKGPNKAACFMDIPLPSLKYVLNASNTNPEKPRYEPYGIVVTKKYAYDRGCRPVLYLSNEELILLSVPESELWRVVRFDGVDGSAVNWIHEREWRAKGTFILPHNPHTVLVKSVSEAAKLRQHIDANSKTFKAKPSSIIPLVVLCQGLPYLTK